MINIIIPCYHSRETLPNTLRSLEWQTKRMFTTTLVIDCDGEDYSDIVSQFHFHIDVITLDKNVGPGVARQAGLDRTNCSHVLFLDSDDMLQPRAIEVLSRECRGTDADIIQPQLIHEQKYGSSNVLENSQTWIHGKVYSVNFLRKNNIKFHPDLRINEDVYFNCLAYYFAEKKYTIAEPLVIWCDNHNSTTRRKQNDELIYTNQLSYTYINALLYTIQELNLRTDILKNNLKSSICWDICQIYNTYQTIKYTKAEDHVNYTLLKNVLNDANVAKVLHSKEFYEQTHKNIDTIISYKKNNYLIKQSFIDFLNQYLEVPYEDYHC